MAEFYLICELRYYFTLFVNHVTLRRLNRYIKKRNVESKVIVLLSYMSIVLLLK